jgi:hypothetical protein
MPASTVASMTNDDPLADFLKRQQAVSPPVVRTQPPQRLTITRLHLPFGDVFRFTLQMFAASLIISVALSVVTLLVSVPSTFQLPTSFFAEFNSQVNVGQPC